jgi:hypothetical protein
MASLATVVTVGVGVGLGFVLREPFGPLRLLTKGVAPIAVALPALAILPPGGVRRGLLSALSVATMGALGGLCLGVYGIPLTPEVLLPLLGLAQPPLTPTLFAFSGLVGMTLLSFRYSWAPSPARTMPDLLLAAAESTYFGGFLLASTTHLGVWSWALGRSLGPHGFGESR